MKRKFTTNWYNRSFGAYYRDQIGAFRSPAQDNQEIGIEIEVEGRGLPRDGLVGWDIHEDGSLRGESAEYVFRGPTTRYDTSVRLRTLNDRLIDSGARINQSYRTSVHIHMNCRPMLIKQIYSNIMLYIMCEDVFAEIAGKDRIGNLFCLRAKDAGFFIDQLRESIIRDNIGLLGQENLRYSAVNPQALFRHGSLEFRSFRGTTDIELIQQWVNLLCALKDAATRYPNPVEVCKDFSTKGPVAWAQSIFNDQQIASFPRGWEDMLTEGVQLIQHAAFGHDWSIPATPEEKVVIKKKKSAGIRYDDVFRPMQAGQVIAPGGNPQWEIAPLPEPDWDRIRNRIVEDDV